MDGAFLFQFLDAGLHSEGQFVKALDEFSKQNGLMGKATHWIKNIGSLSTEVAEVKAEVTLLQGQVNSSILSSITKLAQQGKPILLLLDEIQALASSKYKTTIASLRTALDMHKETIKVVLLVQVEKA